MPSQQEQVGWHIKARFYEYTCPGCGKAEIADFFPKTVVCDGRKYDVRRDTIRPIMTRKPEGVTLSEVDVVSLPVSSIVTHPIKLRPLNNDVINGIALSFRTQGQRQPILVRPMIEGKYRAVFGEHRLEAAKRIEMRSILCMVDSTLDDETEMELKLTENIQRNNFTDPSAEGQAFAGLLKTKYATTTALADAISKPASYITDRIRIYEKLHPCIKPLVGGKISISSAMAISRLDQDKQLALANQLIDFRNRRHSTEPQPQQHTKLVVKTCECPSCGDKHESAKEEIVCASE